MSKFLRKYQKFLLVIFASALMVVFVAPQAITRIGQGIGKRTEVYIGERSINTLDLQQAGREREAIGSFISFATGSPQYASILTGENSLHWILLTHAAREAGFIGEAGDGEAWVNQFSAQQASLLDAQLAGTDEIEGTPDQVLQFARAQLEGQRQRSARNSRLSLDEFNIALAKGRGISRMLAFYRASPRISVPAAVAEAKHQLDDIDIEYVFIRGERVYEGEIEESQLQAHFERYQNVEPGEGEFGIGYIRPERVTFEVITFERNAIRDAIPITAREMVNEYRSNSGRYVTEFDETLSEDELSAAREVEYEKARQTLREARAQELVGEGALQVRRLVLPTLTRGDRGLVVIPEGSDHAGPTLDELADGIQAFWVSFYERRYGAPDGTFSPPRPRINVYASTWRTLNELSRIPDLGFANVSMGGNRTMRFPNFVLSVRELNPDITTGPQRGVLAVENKIENQFSGMLSFVRVLDVQDRSPAESVDEVRELAESDLRSVLGYQEILPRVSEFRSLAIADGLEAVGALFDDLPEDSDPAEETDPTESPGDDPIGPEPDPEQADDPELDPTEDAELEGEDDSPPRPRILVQRGSRVVADRIEGRLGQAGEIDEPELVERIEQMRDALDPLVEMDGQSLELRTVAFALPKRLGVAVVQISGMRPLTVERYRTEGIAAAAGGPMASINALEAFSLEAMVKRLNVRDRDGSSPLRDEDQTASAR